MVLHITKGGSVWFYTLQKVVQYGSTHYKRWFSMVLHITKGGSVWFYTLQKVVQYGSTHYKR